MQDQLQLYRPQDNPPPPPEGKPSFADLQEAAEWFATLRADHASEADQRKWRTWMDASAAHRAAWKRVEAVNAEFGLLPAAIDHRVLAPRGMQRRKAIKTLGWLAAGVTAVGALGRSADVQGYIAAFNAGYRTDIGQTSKQQLADGSLLWLNTGSAADVDYNATLRRVVLHRGELLIQSAHDDHVPARALVVDVPAGRMEALGTRFLVRLDDGATILSVLEGRVRITPAGKAAPVIIDAGAQVRFNADHVDTPSAADESMGAWSRNLLLPDGMRLDTFLAELGRYRRGYLGCAPEVASLRLVGVYPLNDTDRILHALEATLPVKVRRILPWWVTVEAAAKPD